MLTALLFVIAAEAPMVTVLDGCACPQAETNAQRVERLRGELRSAELAVIAERVNAQHMRKAKLKRGVRAADRMGSQREGVR